MAMGDRKQGRDRIATVSLMLARLGFLGAIVLGLGMMFGAITAGGAVMLHIVAGAVVLGGIWVALIRFAMLGRRVTGPLMAGAILALAGALLGLGTNNGWVAGDYGLLHFLIMLAAVGLAEMGAARLNRA